MKMLFLPLFFLISAITARAAILPEIFYAGESEQKKFCSESKFQTEEFWRKLMSEKIDLHLEEGNHVLQNSFVTLSYLELFNIPSKSPLSSFMGYVYANGSHHLGRLVRYTKWPSNHPFKKDDQKLVQGLALKLIAQNASHELSRRLMHHSFNLYKTLAWSLASAHLCGKDYTLEIVSDPDLLDAFNSSSSEEFIRSFVTYEQSYLQTTMYSDFLIGTAAKGKVLDEMRFISFNGEKQQSFMEWCKQHSCKTSSFNLENRIEFDTSTIVKELKLTSNRKERLQERATSARILSTTLIFTH